MFTLSEEDFKPDLWEGAKKACWTLQEAAYYVNELGAGGPIDIHQTNEISRAYVWLNKEHQSGRLKNIFELDEVVFTPGTMIRHLWEGEKPVSLKMWALYTYADKGEVCGLLRRGISKKNYLKTAKIIKDKFPDVTKAETIRFLMTLPDRIKGKNDIPVFFNMSETYLIKLLSKNGEEGARGRKKDKDRIFLEEHSDYLVDIIRKELGY